MALRWSGWVRVAAPRSFPLRWSLLRAATKETTLATAGPFDFDTDIHGARVIVIHPARHPADRRQTPLHPACANDDEVDFHVGVLKDQLDQLAIAMKQAIREQAKKPLFSGRGSTDDPSRA